MQSWCGGITPNVGEAWEKKEHHSPRGGRVRKSSWDGNQGTVFMRGGGENNPMGEARRNGFERLPF